MLNLDTGLYTLGGDQAELTKALRRAGRVDLDHLDSDARRNATVLRNAGVSYVILSRSDVRQKLQGNEDFELVFEYEQPGLGHMATRRNGKTLEPLAVAVYRLRDGGSWLHGAGLRVLDMDYSPERISWKIDMAAGRPSRTLSASVNWHPNWAVTVDGIRVETRSSPAHHVTFDAPADAASVTLEFERSAREKAYNVLSAAVLLAVFTAWRRGSRRHVAGNNQVSSS
jgi:hypothetical protein